MKNFFTNVFALIIAFLITIPYSLYSGIDAEEMTEKLPALLGQNNMGKDFFFSIPPVYEEVTGDNFVRVLVTSAVETEVTISNKAKSLKMVKKTIPNGVIDFRLTPSLAQVIPHSIKNVSPPAQIYKEAAVSIKADDPIVVYVVIKYKYTSDGFLALPVSSFGDRYINMVYPDPGFGVNNGSAPAFTCVVGAFDNTDINMTMGGGPEGTDILELENGDEIATGEKTSFVLNEGDVWLGASSGHYLDISGSLFKGSKPFGIVSGMHCANFPLGNSWCDYSVEMELPTNVWGKQYFVTPMIDRTYNGVIRVFASEPNTKVYRDDELMGELTHGGGNSIDKAYLEFRVWPKEDGNGDPIPPKIATIHADKPIAVMYYNTGTQEDFGNANSDPFQMQFTPVEQYQNQIIFASPNAVGGSDFFELNYINVVFEMTDNSIPDDLLFAQLFNNKAATWKSLSDVVSQAPKVFTKEYNGKKYGTVTVELPNEGVFSLKSEFTKFAAYSYGFSPYESYGFQTSSATKDITKEDTKAPNPTFVSGKVTENTKVFGSVIDMPEDEGKRVNLADVFLIENLNDNFEFEYSNPESKESTIIPGKDRELSWSLTVKDISDTARATIYFLDRAGNDTTITVSYEPSGQTNIELIQEGEYKLFPNPTKNKITLSLSNNTNIDRYEIFDLEGNSILSGNGNLSSIQTIDIKSLVKGMYIIECYTTDKKLIRDKFIKDE
ncbi:MAG: T9SS type A sorting domain-containing protein [Chlorobiota bacterium]